MSYAPARRVTLAPGQSVEVELLASSSSPAADDWGTSLLDSTGGTVTEGEGSAATPDGETAGQPASDPLYSPEVSIQIFGESELVVTVAPPGPPGERLFGGDRVVSIDGTSADDSSAAMGALYGPKDSICTIVARRPATGETLTVALPRTRGDDESGGWK